MWNHYGKIDVKSDKPIYGFKSDADINQEEQRELKKVIEKVISKRVIVKKYKEDNHD
jgi:hypothetical protein